ncbi:MAG: hypothetical protein DDT27_01230 [Dehalococcoidia bacterium]|nr:hypothetical protein [Chloroflexota bacterium]MBT9160840.1 hypothetical protein [Chloroflexota bacterium]MBT9162671.1 hypothetical protein [Chloroflexota bacterium]
MARFRNSLIRLLVSADMPRSIRVVVLTTIGLLIATTALIAIERVTGWPDVGPMCGPWDRPCPFEFF